MSQTKPLHPSVSAQFQHSFTRLQLKRVTGEKHESKARTTSHLTKTVQKQATKLSLRPRPKCTQWVEPEDLRCNVGSPVSVSPRRGAELLGLFMQCCRGAGDPQTFVLSREMLSTGISETLPPFWRAGTIISSAREQSPSI